MIIPFRIFEKFSPKVQTEALTRQDNFICVPFLYFRDQILLTVNANSEFTWTTADTVLVYKLFVFHSSWILGQYERNIVLTYILRAFSLSCHDKIILFRILRFFGVEESIWSRITNPFSDSPKETHPVNCQCNHQSETGAPFAAWLTARRNLMKHLKIKLGWEFVCNQRTYTCAFFEIRDRKLFQIKRFIKVNPSLLLKIKRAQFSLLGKVSLF